MIVHMTIVKLIFQLAGSLGFLLYGMKLMSDGIQKSAGEKLQRTLGLMTGNKFVALLTGLFVTMIIQSSGATTVMIVTFVNAGLLTLSQSIGVIFGANIGTTITAWIVSIFGFSFKISTMTVPVFGIGFLLTMMKKSSCKNIGDSLMGFGLLFLGLSMLSEAISFDTEKLVWLKDLQSLGYFSIFIGFLIGILITALLHSSSAFTAIIITMAVKGLVTWEFAAAMTLGSNIGSTIDVVLASLGSSVNAKRVALIHVLFNVIGSLLILIIFKPFLTFVTLLTPGGESANIAIRISILHTIFNVSATLCFLPFSNQIVRLSEKIIPNKKSEISTNYKLEFQNLAGKDNVAAHIIQAEKAISDMTDIITNMFDRVQIGLSRKNADFIPIHIERISSEENYVDQMHEQITNYLLKCETLPLTEKQMGHASKMIQIVEELESMSDNCFSSAKLIQKSIEKKMKIKQEDMDRMIPYMELARQFLQFIYININKQLDANKLAMATELEQQIDDYRKELKRVARKRLELGADVKAELLYIDIVRQIEKIGDNCFSIASCLTDN